MATDERTMQLVPDATELPAVALVTALAETADLSDTEYREIFDRVATGHSLRDIEMALHSAVSFAWWGRYANGRCALDRARKNELRIWYGLPELPPTPAEAVANLAHVDAAVYQVGSAPASRVVLIGATVPAVALRVNGDCRLLGDTAPQDAPEGTRTGLYTAAPRGTIHLSRPAWERLSAARQAAGLGWEEFLSRLVDDPSLGT